MSKRCTLIHTSAKEKNAYGGVMYTYEHYKYICTSSGNNGYGSESYLNYMGRPLAKCRLLCKAPINKNNHMYKRDSCTKA